MAPIFDVNLKDVHDFNAKMEDISNLHRFYCTSVIHISLLLCQGCFSNPCAQHVSVLCVELGTQLYWLIWKIIIS